MNALNMARTAYSSTTAPIRTAQSTEYEAFAHVTRRIRAAMQRGQPAFNHLVAALNDNRRLWIVLAADVAEEENALPEMLRAQIFYLAEFTLQHTTKVLNKTAKPDVLVEINTAVMRGLRQKETVA